MMGNMSLGWGWPIVFGWLGLAMVVALLVWSLLGCRAQRGTREDSMGVGEPPAREILERRYARGELSDEQFEAMRRRLTPPASAYDMT
jgi:putative membrane protein